MNKTFRRKVLGVKLLSVPWQTAGQDTVGWPPWDSGRMARGEDKTVKSAIKKTQSVGVLAGVPRGRVSRILVQVVYGEVAHTLLKACA